MISIYYGVLNNFIDVTNIVFEKCTKNNIIYIPGDCDERDSLFTDPFYGVNKYIFFNTKEDNANPQMRLFYRGTTVLYDILNREFYVDNIPKSIGDRYFNQKTYVSKWKQDDLENIKRNKISNDTLTINLIPKITDRDMKLDLCSKLNDIHKKLKIDFGMFYENMAMQILILKYINGLEKVLEIGGNIGRCSLLVANILNAKSNTDFVSLESNPDYAKQLMHNRNQNELSFHVEISALSKQKLIQLKDETSVSDVLVDGFFQVNTISWIDLCEIYSIVFDTLIIDCNDAFYNILLDFPEMLKTMKLIIMKNEYYDVIKKIQIEKILTEWNFYLDYSEMGGNCPCYYSYYEVWIAK